MDRDVVLLGDALTHLRALPDGCVQCCVTSPPYFGLRDYGRSEQLGLESSPALYIEHIVEVFREVKRVLRDDGTLWLNLGDSYCSTGPGTMGDPLHQRGIFSGVKDDTAQARRKFRPETPDGMKPKDLMGIPWMVALALRADGWYLRSDIIWAKGNVMPESVKDRPTKAHEYVFLLSKSERYFYDVDAIREPHTSSAKVIPWQHKDYDQDMLPADSQQEGKKGRPQGVAGFGIGGRNRRSVWHINPKPYKGAHFATFPEELPEVCIKAGTSAKGSCAKCGAPWERVVSVAESTQEFQRDQDENSTSARKADGSRLTSGTGNRTIGGKVPTYLAPVVTGETWEPGCTCEAEVVPCVVLDPFAGSGTTLAVAAALRRSYVGIELNPEYHKLIQERLEDPMDFRAAREGFEDIMGF